MHSVRKMKLAPHSRRWAAFALLMATIASATVSPANAEVLERSAAGVAGITYQLPGSLVIRQGYPERLTISADSEVLRKLSVQQQGNTLTVKSSGNFSTDKPIQATLVVKSLHSLKAGSSGEVLVDKVQGTSLAVTADGSSDISLRDIKQDSLTVQLDGSGIVQVSGTGDKLVARISGSGNIDADRYAVRQAHASITGSGDIRVSASDRLKAEIGGAGKIRYRGNPSVEQSVSGAGSVKPY